MSSQILGNPKVFVTSVKSGYEERQAFINKQMKQLSIEFEYIFKFDISDNDINQEKKYYFNLDDFELISPTQSLFLKHIEALKIIRENKIELALVFEDDAIFSDDFIDIINLALVEYMQIDKPSVISLGHGNNLYTPRSQMVNSKYLYQGTRMRCTDSYVLRYKEASLILEAIDNYIKSGNKIVWAIDYFYDHIFRSNGIDFLWLEPSIVTQGSMNGIFTSELDRKRGGRTLLMNKIHYLANYIVKRIKRYFK